MHAARRHQRKRASAQTPRAERRRRADAQASERSTKSQRCLPLVCVCASRAPIEPAGHRPANMFVIRPPGVQRTQPRSYIPYRRAGEQPPANSQQLWAKEALRRLTRSRSALRSCCARCPVLFSSLSGFTDMRLACIPQPTGRQQEDAPLCRLGTFCWRCFVL